MAQMLTLLATQLSVPEIVPVILKKLNIPETEEILEAMDIKKQAQMTIEELQNRVKQLEGISQQQAGQIEEKSKQLSVSQFEKKLTRSLEGFKTKFKDDLNARKEIDDLLNVFNPANQQGVNDAGQ
jgi:cysteinyl-tRNA synthetase